MKIEQRKIWDAEKVFDLITRDGIKPGAAAKAYDGRGRLIDFGYVVRVYFDDGDGSLPPVFRIGIASALFGRDMYYDHTNVSGVQ